MNEPEIRKAIEHALDAYLTGYVMDMTHLPTLDHVGNPVPSDAVQQISTAISTHLMSQVTPIITTEPVAGGWAPDGADAYPVQATKVTGRVMLFATLEDLQAFKDALANRLVRCPY